MKKTMLLILTMLFCAKLIGPPIKDSNNLEGKYKIYLEQKREAERKAELNRYLLAFGFSESSCNPNIINILGYCGYYQLGYSARKITGYGHITLIKFKQDPNIWPKEQQDTAMMRLLKINEDLLQLEIALVKDSLVIKNILVTKSGLLAAAHLAGYGGVKKFIRTKGEYDPVDINGTKLSDYLNKFSKFNI